MSASENPAPGLVAAGASLDQLAVAADGCTACDLYERATQAVFGTGGTGARLMLLGEQPGDEEDREGAPFVGPAGRMLDEAIAGAGLTRDDIYISNVVKHFRWKPGAKKRHHQKPTTRHIRACRPWLEAELALVDPEVVELNQAWLLWRGTCKEVTAGRQRVEFDNHRWIGNGGTSLVHHPRHD